MNDLGRLSAEEARKNATKYPVVVVLDNIRSMHNIGSIFRTADALNVSELFLCGITAQPPHREITKTALGATDSVAWQYFPNTIQALTELKNKGYTIVGIEQVVESVPLQAINFDDKHYAFVFGNEVNGIEQETLNFCDIAVEIPQFGMKHSFNVSVTSAIVLWEYVRKKL